MTKTRIFAVVPAYNEEKTIRAVVHSLSKYVDRIIVVDDGSTDSTSRNSRHEKVTIVKHLFNLGQGAALQTGFEYSLKAKADIVLTYDADGQFDVSEIPSMIKPIREGKTEVVLGSRFLGTAIQMPFLRYVILKLGIIFTYFYSGIVLTDTHNGFRAISRKALRHITLSQNKMAYASEIVDQIKKKKLTFIEMPVTVRYTEYSRKKGQKNTGALEIVSSLVFKDFGG